jgi:hypothetical protein
VKPIIFVAGLGRCGTSLTMQMLHRAGISCAGRWPSFEPPQIKPRGTIDSDWLMMQCGGAVKWLDPHLARFENRVPGIVIWLDRDWKEQAKSQIKMAMPLIGDDPTASRREWRAMMAGLRRDRAAALHETLRFPRMFTTFERLILSPLTTSLAIAHFLLQHGYRVDAEVMAEAVLPRKIACRGDLSIELSLIEKEAAHAEAAEHD